MKLIKFAESRGIEPARVLEAMRSNCLYGATNLPGPDQDPGPWDTYFYRMVAAIEAGFEDRCWLDESEFDALSDEEESAA